MQFDQMAVIPSELRMLEQSNQYPHIILFIIITIIIIFFFFNLFIYLLFKFFLLLLLLLLLFFFISVCGWIPGLLCLNKKKTRTKK